MSSYSFKEDSKKHVSWSIGKILFGTYRIKKLLGRGGMGEVFLVERITDGHLFAVKMLIPPTTRSKEKETQFFREIRTWIDIPEHPNIVTCRFLRTLENRSILFTDYVDGGNLTHWLKSGKIKSVKNIIDVAIQTAWGLSTSHESGVVHQDIKPANIMMTRSGEAKIADFGLANARVTSLQDSAEFQRTESKLTSYGMTVLYCSPEQAAAEKVSPKTDQWNWAVSMLELFTGGTKWRLGLTAPLYFSEIQAGNVSSEIAIPPGIQRILSRCFQMNPDDRWPDMLSIADALRQEYRNLTGEDYFRIAPKVIITQEDETSNYEHKTYDGLLWDDPDHWLKLALEASGKKYEDIKHLVPVRQGSSQAQNIIDREIFALASDIFLELFNQGQVEFINLLDTTLQKQALIAENIGDFEGAIELLKKLRDLNEYAYQELNMSSRKYNLASQHSDLSYLFMYLKRYSEAELAALEAIKILQSPCDKKNDDQTLKSYSFALNNLAGIYLNQGKLTEALERLDQSDLAIRSISDYMSQDTIVDLLASNLKNKGIILSEIGHMEEAIERLLEGIHYREHLVVELGDSEKTYFLIKDYINYSAIEGINHNVVDALKYLDKAEALCHKYFKNQPPVQYYPVLIHLYINRSSALAEVERDEEALKWLDECQNLAEQMVNEFGRMEFLENIARMQLTKLAIYRTRKEFDLAMPSIRTGLKVVMEQKQLGIDLRDPILEYRLRYGEIEIFFRQNELDQALLKAQQLYSDMYADKIHCEFGRFKCILEEVGNFIQNPLNSKFSKW